MGAVVISRRVFYHLACSHTPPPPIACLRKPGKIENLTYVGIGAALSDPKKIFRKCFSN